MQGRHKNMYCFWKQHDTVRALHLKEKGSYEFYGSLFSKVVESHCGKHRMYKPRQTDQEKQ